MGNGKYNTKINKCNINYRISNSGRGFYNELGLKNGNWVELSDSFEKYI